MNQISICTLITITTLNLMISTKIYWLSTSRQKQQQLPMDTHENMIDGICLWMWLAPKLQSLVTSEYMAKLTDMFHKGKLGSYFLEG